jgi:hypothetical protein
MLNKPIKKMLKLFFALLFINCYSQEKYEYFGTVKLNGSDKSVITYRLVFLENNGSVKGYSVTDLGGNNETKNAISGSYNKKTKELIFKEESILYTKSTFKDDMFCFINFSGKVKLVENSSKLEGNFRGLYKNKKKCIDGTLMLIGSVKLYKLLDKMNNAIQKSKKVDPVIKEKVNPKNILDSLKVNNLLKDQNLNIFVKSSSLELEIWDAKKEDGDMINVYNNDKLVLSNYVILNKKKKIIVNIENGENVFKIEALNEGDMKPNTATIQLTDKERTFELMSNLKKGEKASITIIKSEN